MEIRLRAHNQERHKKQVPIKGYHYPGSDDIPEKVRSYPRISLLVWAVERPVTGFLPGGGEIRKCPPGFPDIKGIFNPSSTFFLQSCLEKAGGRMQAMAVSALSQPDGSIMTFC
jgi:hypothetical protein